MNFNRDVVTSGYEVIFSLTATSQPYQYIHSYDRGDLSFVIISGAMVYLMVPGLGAHSYIFSEPPCSN